MRERLDDPQSELFALLRCVDRDILDMSDGSQAAEKLALEEDGTDTDDAVCIFRHDDERIVRIRYRSEGVELRNVGGFAWVRNGGQDAQNRKMTAVIVRCS